MVLAECADCIERVGNGTVLLIINETEWLFPMTNNYGCMEFEITFTMQMCLDLYNCLPNDVFSIVL